MNKKCSCLTSCIGTFSHFSPVTKLKPKLSAKFTKVFMQLLHDRNKKIYINYFANVPKNLVT